MARKATYDDIQELKGKLARSVSEFRNKFGEIPVEITVKTELLTNHGVEVIGFKLKDIPAFDQGQLPFEMYTERNVPERSFARMVGGE